MQGDTVELPTRASRRRELEQGSRSRRRRARHDAPTRIHAGAPTLGVPAPLLVEEKTSPEHVLAGETRASRRAVRPATRRLLPALLVANITAVAAAGALAWTGMLPVVEVGTARGGAPSIPTDRIGPAGSTSGAPTSQVRPVDELCIAHAGDALDLDSLEGRVLVTAAGGSDLEAWCRDVTGRG